MSSKELGRRIGRLESNQRSLQDNIGPREPNPNFLFRGSDTVKVKVKKVEYTKRFYLSDSFVLDHPVRCDLDSNFYKLDGGYDSSLDDNVVVVS